ncbi:asparaginase [Gilvimarinus sp. F26214L]|uniref:asparaginase n=1 Tax=Gilvimarinus sp. DZF01 TaxID=3461371 RepID=UPI004045F5E7
MSSNNPILVEVIRGGAVESTHRGRALVMRSDGETLWSVGDIDELTYPRSSLKAFQALPMVASGAADTFGLDDVDLALACASHNGEAQHATRVAAVLSKLGLGVADLECGHHWPMGEQATVDLAWQQQNPDALHNNCSGKHAAMLAFALQKQWDHKGYVQADHPVQQAIRTCVEQCCDVDLSHAPESPDGCSAPIWAMPLHRLALGFARFGDPEQLPAEYQEAARRLYQAAVNEPFYVAGTGRYCSQVMEELKGRVFLKVGAEGVYIASIPEWRLGVALKIDSGAKEAAEVALSEILHRLGLPIEDKQRRPPICNRNGWTTGETRPASESFDKIPRLTNHT